MEEEEEEEEEEDEEDEEYHEYCFQDGNGYQDEIEESDKEPRDEEEDGEDEDGGGLEQVRWFLASSLSQNQYQNKKTSKTSST